ncbi:MAG: rRNA cytosine-C5-methylase [Rikenellaceae bacterium]
MDNRVAIPIPFIERLREQRGAELAESLIASLDGTTPTSVRVNRDKEGARALDSFESEAIGWSIDGYYLSERPAFIFESAFHAGAYYVQEASSQFISHILNSSDKSMRGAMILDCCAAPGGKSTLYSSAVGREGLVVASEINRSRASVLADNVRRWGLGNVVVACCDTTHHSAFESFYDVVAVDAPCSGEGMFRKSDVAREEWSEDGVKVCAERQMDILMNVWGSLNSGGALIYSTCTFNREENEEVLERFIEWCDEGEIASYEQIEIDEQWGVERFDVGAFQCFRFMPHRSRGEGFFVAVARKSFDVSSRLRMPRSSKRVFAPIGKGDVRECSQWVCNPKEISFLAIGESIYGYYNAKLEQIKRLCESLNVIYSGVEIGEIIKGKLNPSPALAHFADLNRERVSIATLDRDNMLSYLRKESVDVAPFTEGLNLVVDSQGYAVGFAKRIGNRVNNRYPNELRIIKGSSHNSPK